MSAAVTTKGGHPHTWRLQRMAQKAKREPANPAAHGLLRYSRRGEFREPEWDGLHTHPATKKK